MSSPNAVEVAHVCLRCGRRFYGRTERSARRRLLAHWRRRRPCGS